MNKVEVLNDFNKINESKITNEELLDFVHKLGYNSIDEIFTYSSICFSFSF